MKKLTKPIWVETLELVSLLKNHYGQVECEARTEGRPNYSVKFNSEADFDMLKQDILNFYPNWACYQLGSPRGATLINSLVPLRLNITLKCNTFLMVDDDTYIEFHFPLNEVRIRIGDFDDETKCQWERKIKFPPILNLYKKGSIQSFIDELLFMVAELTEIEGMIECKLYDFLQTYQLRGALIVSTQLSLSDYSDSTNVPVAFIDNWF